MRPLSDYNSLVKRDLSPRAQFLKNSLYLFIPFQRFRREVKNRHKHMKYIGKMVDAEGFEPTTR
jgi:hypothetical protein